MKIHPTAAAAVACIESGQRVFVHGAAATPLALLDGLIEHAPRLRNVELMHLHTAGDGRYADPEFAESFRISALFLGSNMRRRVDHERIDYIPCFLSETAMLIRTGRRPIDVVLISVSPPDAHGYCTLGTSVDCTLAAVETAKVVIAQINSEMPRVHGDGFLHVSRITHAVEVSAPLPENPPEPLSETELAIGRHVASLVEDGACLQTGIGAIPDAALAALANHKHLGVHTEMWSDGMLPLFESGAIDNSRKAVHPGKTVATFLMGSRKVFDHADDNPASVLLDVAYVNNTAVIARNDRVTAINSAVEIDLTGQVCADSVGHRVLSGVGGQMDFIRAASLSKGGKPIIAIASRTGHGIPRIVAELKPGAGVVTTRAHMHYVATEFGVADLFGKTLNERARALIELAHPDDREALDRAWHDRRTATAGYTRRLEKH
ncbi:MAG: acetyl-CoA hydrolase/transferase family protein [Planctomycetota bacterium]